MWSSCTISYPSSTKNLSVENIEIDSSETLIISNDRDSLEDYKFKRNITQNLGNTLSNKKYQKHRLNFINLENEVRIKTKHEAIQNAFDEEELENCRTLHEIKINEKFKKKLRKKSYHNFLQINKPWYIPPNENIQKIPFYKRFPCLPKFMMKIDYKTNNYKDILKLIETGVQLFHINLKYGTKNYHEKTISCIKKAQKLYDQMTLKPTIIGIAVEINGQKLKTGLVRNYEISSNIKKNGVFLDKNSIVCLTSNRKYSTICDHKVIYVNFHDYVKNLKQYDYVYIGTEIKLQIHHVDLNNHRVTSKVITEGLLLSKMTVRIPPFKCLLDNIKSQYKKSNGKNCQQEQQQQQPTFENSINTFYITKEQKEDIQFAFNELCNFIIIPYALELQVNIISSYIRWLMLINEYHLEFLVKINSKQNLIKSDIIKILKEFSGIYLADDCYTQKTDNDVKDHYNCSHNPRVDHNQNTNNEHNGDTDDNKIRRELLQNFIIGSCWFHQKLLIRANILNLNENHEILLPILNNVSSRTDQQSYIEKFLKEYFLYPDCIAISARSLNKIGINSIQLKAHINTLFCLNDDQYDYSDLQLKFCCKTLTMLKSKFKKMKLIETEFYHKLITTVLLDKITCIICVSKNMKTIQFLSKYYLPIPIITVSKTNEIAKISLIQRNVIPLIFSDTSQTCFNSGVEINNNDCDDNKNNSNDSCRSECLNELDDMIKFSINYCHKENYILDNENFIVVYDSNYRLAHADSFRILNLKYMKNTLYNCDH